MAIAKPKKASRPSTQQYLQIQEIKDNVVVLKDGTLRGVILVSSMNFALKSEEEQNAVISAYTQFLNSFDFTIQIVIQSRKLNIDVYLDHLKEIEKQQTNELLKMQTKEYREYVAEFVEIADIMSKRFYVIVPYSPFSNKPKGFFKRLGESLSPTRIIRLQQQKFEKFSGELAKRVNYVIDNLSGMGLKAIPLDTQSLIELYYNTYNPQIATQQKLEKLEKLEVEETNP
ncbi:MAG: hypothetical protein HY341_02100 [Candidatus Kerfeldbacteria bacterium]|nr:hypothetical protein [Candidatus Kerfeldbacteria bacterium]